MAYPHPLKTFQADALAVRVYSTHDDLAVDAAHRAFQVLHGALQRRGSARAIIASAASQVRFLNILTPLPGLDWSRITLFHMDEYLGVSDQHSASFRRFLRERVELIVHPKIFHYIRGEADEPISECARFTSLLKEAPIDLCCLGIGENGHVAFNDPPVANFDDPLMIKIVKLDEACRRQQVGEGAFASIDAMPQFAYSLTIPALCKAETMLCIVPERRKAAAVRDTLHGPIDPKCPASILRRQSHATLFLDADSASLLS